MNWTIPIRRETMMSTMFAEPVVMTTETAFPADPLIAPEVLDAEANEFNYRPVPALVPASGAFVLLSISAFIWDVLVLVPVVSFGLSLMAVRQIRRSPGEWSGLTAALVFAVLSFFAMSGSISLHAYNYVTELPTGFERVSFARDISDRGFIVRDGQTTVPPEVQELSGKPVFVKGFMYPEQQTVGLTRFVLCKDSGDCCFGGQPKPTDMIVVEMVPGKTINYRAGLVSVAGVFEARPTVDTSGVNPVYRVTAERFGGAMTSY